MKHTHVYDHYYLYGEIAEIVKGYAAQYPQYAKLDVLGQTEEGRDILLLEITDLSTGDFADKPAYYVEGNIHAGEVTGSMTVMYLMDTIFSNLDDPEIAKILKKNTFYLLPRVSPDGTEHYLTTPESLRSVPRYYPYAAEMPGLQPKDLDGDGAIRLMRVKTPYGAWKKSALDDRLMTRRLPDDDEGEFYNIYPEGVINDYDGLSIHEAPQKFGNDFNRNYPIGWEPEWMQRGAGKHPLSNPETKANAEFLLSHKNVCACVDMHTSGGMILYTPGYKSAKDADPADVALYRVLGQMAAEESGYPLLNVYDDFMPKSAPVTYGGFDDFCHFIVGIPAFTIECWDLDVRAGVQRSFPPKENQPEKEREADEYKVLQWLDANLTPEQGFKPWTAFDHPQLGEVEIGGVYSKFVEQNPPTPFLEQEVAKHTRFMLREVKALPKVQFEKATAEKLADGLYRVEAVLGNTGFMSTYVFREALKNKALKGLSVALSGYDSLTEGKAVQDIGHLQGYSGIRTMDWGIPARSRETEPFRKKVSWIVRAQSGAALKLVCTGDRIGKVEAEVVLD